MRLITLLMLAICSNAFAEDMADEYFVKKDLKTTKQENAGLAIGSKFHNQSTKPFQSADGSITFIYGTGQIHIMCAVTQICDIALQQGEATVADPQVGDPRFKIETLVAGAGANARQHIIIKPLEVGIDTTMMIATNKRAYHFRLRTDRRKFMPYITFTYPDEMTSGQTWRRAASQIAANENMATDAKSGDFDWNYKIDGDDVSWKPKDGMVYNDGVKTIIRMPDVLSQKEAPALLLLKSEGGIFSDDETAIVNYSLQNGKYIVESVFDKAILVSGAGDNQEKVTITREQK